MITTKKPRPEMKPCPVLGCVQAAEFQLFDNGEKPGKGKVRHKLKVELYCEDKLVMGKPYWSRVCDLLDVKTFMRWVEREHAEGTITEGQYAEYDAARMLCEQWEADEQRCEFAKLGHIEGDGNSRFRGQFVIVLKEAGKGLTAVLARDGDIIEQRDWQYNPGWPRNKRARKFMGRWDPHNMFGKARTIKEYDGHTKATNFSEPRPSFLSPQELALARVRAR